MSSVDKNDLMDLMAVQRLLYSPPVDGSLVNTRTQKRYNFQQLSVSSGQTAQLILNSGSDYIWGPNCHLLFTIDASGGGGATTAPVSSFGTNGSAINCIQNITITHRSGDQLEHITEVNALVQSLDKYQESKDYENYGEVYGLGLDEDFSSVISSDKLQSRAREYAIPMSKISGLFATNKLMPSYLCAGMKIEIKLESFAKAVSSNVDGTGAGAAFNNKYTLSNLRLSVDSYDLFDAAKKALMEQATDVQTMGLQFAYNTWFNFSTQISGTAFNIDVQKSASKTCMVIAKSRDTSNFVEGQDSMASTVYDYAGWRFRLGSVYLPQDTVDSVAESYFLSQKSFGNSPVGHPDKVNSDRVDPKHSVKYSDYRDNAGYAIVAQELEKNAILSLSGEPTNNSRLLNFSGTCPAIATRQIDIWLKYVQVANVMISNVVVDS